MIEPVPTLKSAHIRPSSWAEVTTDIKGLYGWVMDANVAREVVDLVDRIEVGTRRRIEAVDAGDEGVVAAIDARLEELRVQLWALDSNARRLGVMRALAVLRVVAGPCDVDVSTADGVVRACVRG